MDACSNVKLAGVHKNNLGALQRRTTGFSPVVFLLKKYFSVTFFQIRYKEVLNHKIKQMKKLLAIVAFAAFMTSCNDASTTEETTTDSSALVTTPSATTASADSANTVNAADSAAKLANEASNTLDSANKAVDKAADKLKDASKQVKEGAQEAKDAVEK